MWCGVVRLHSLDSCASVGIDGHGLELGIVADVKQTVATDGNVCNELTGAVAEAAWFGGVWGGLGLLGLDYGFRV